jgi:hypothetical protein
MKLSKNFGNTGMQALQRRLRPPQQMLMMPTTFGHWGGSGGRSGM